MLVCITGKSGCGKTTAANFLKKAGYDVLVMDEYIHDIYQFGQKGYQIIASNFGSEYVTKSEVDRKKLGSLVFTDKKALAKLNDLMIPIMRQKIIDFAANKKLAFVELAIYLNYHDKFANLFDEVIYIFAPKSQEQRRLKKKFLHLKKLPTKVVENPINQPDSCIFNFKFVVENCQSKKNLEKAILSIAAKL